MARSSGYAPARVRFVVVVAVIVSVGLTSVARLFFPHGFGHLIHGLVSSDCAGAVVFIRALVLRRIRSRDARVLPARCATLTAMPTAWWLEPEVTTSILLAVTRPMPPAARPPRLDSDY